MVERCVRDAEAAGSSPVTSTNKKARFRVFFYWSNDVFRCRETRCALTRVMYPSDVMCAYARERCEIHLITFAAGKIITAGKVRIITCTVGAIITI